MDEQVDHFHELRMNIIKSLDTQLYAWVNSHLDPSITGEIRDHTLNELCRHLRANLTPQIEQKGPREWVVTLVPSQELVYEHRISNNEDYVNSRYSFQEQGKPKEK